MENTDVKYVKFCNEDGDKFSAELRSYNPVTRSGYANYYKNGELYASLMVFLLKDTDEFITEEEFNKTIKLK